ncbi:integrin alpha-PS3-like, partial [Condylostylus longicornis]|uniref:integrin alpha-PS3-like n=1 Tax=Condylostylus longicornis TaxID=2530218 RepID=UPI00244DDB29
IYIYLLLISALIELIDGFNFSPKPNLIFNKPQSNIFSQPTVRSSYFGYSINLRESSLFIGAPRAQSHLESQRNVNETGSIYKCSLVNGLCNPYIFDKYGNQFFENNDYTWNNEKKDNQWLGGSMDGGSKDSDLLVVCAPRFRADAIHEYLMHGICYWTPNTFDEQPTVINKISPLRLKSGQVLDFNNYRSFYYIFGESGLSVHWTGVNDEIIIGAPGIHTWKGSVIRHRLKEEDDFGSPQKRDIFGLENRHRRRLTYDSEVPNPQTWGQPNDSYFGYSVTSAVFEGNSSTRLLYVAGAPQARSQAGEVYIFDIIEIKMGRSYTIDKKQTFHGNQFGEYFGAHVLAEDITGDGWTDLIVSAPLYAIGMNYEMGAVYIYINQGNFNFETQFIVSPSEEPGRFGAAVTKLGDINHDGYNDLAISAPFYGNGKVYIYLGSSTGLHIKPSQILNSPILPNFKSRHMFGLGLSRGVDIDRNEFNDFAIGAPNAERVYLYKTYPVVKVIATISSPSREIQRDQNKLQIAVCFRVETTSTRSQIQDLKLKIKVDKNVKRVNFVDGSTEMDLKVTASPENICQLYDATVKFNLGDIFKPIELELEYELVNGVPDSEEFCEKCAALDPMIPTVNLQKITFSTGCKNEVCLADLKLTSTGLNKTFVLGSSKTISIKYDIINYGETAYLPQLNVTSTIGMPFAKIPSSCKIIEQVLLCDLFQGQPMLNGDKDSITIVFDSSNIDGKSMKIIAEVFSTGNESNSADNLISEVVELTEFSNLEITGESSKNFVSLEETTGLYQFSNTYEIKNHGPSNIREVDIVISIPISYVISESSNRISIINPNNFTLSAKYISNNLQITYYQKDSILIRNPIEINDNSVTASTIFTQQNQQQYEQHFSTVEYLDTRTEKYEKKFTQTHRNENSNELSHTILGRRRRAYEMKATDADYAEISHKKYSFNDQLLGTLPQNRSVVFNCTDNDATLCIKAIMRVNNLRASSDESVKISLKYVVDLDEINKILIEDKEFFVISMLFNITKIGDENSETLSIQNSIPYNIVSKHQLFTIPFWVYILSVLAGILLLALMTYGFYKLGFFKRSKKEEMATLTRNSQNQEDDDDD